jgi:hypothetical protein
MTWWRGLLQMGVRWWVILFEFALSLYLIGPVGKEPGGKGR